MDVIGKAQSWLESTLAGSWTPNEIPDMTGVYALVTGANSGIGFEVCRKLCENNAHVTMVARDQKNGEEAARKIRSEFKAARLDVLECDMSSLRNVERLVTMVRAQNAPLHILVNNAGIFMPGTYAETGDGIEQTMAVDYYAPALLTLGLLDKLRESRPSRIVFTASDAEQFGRLDWTNLRGTKYTDSGMVPYGTAKLYNIMFAKELQVRLEGSGVDVYAVNPGTVRTPLMDKTDKRFFGSWFALAKAWVVGLDHYKGAYSTLYAATEPKLHGKGFKYISPNYTLQTHPTAEREPSSRAAHNPVSGWRLFEETVHILQEQVGSRSLHVPRAESGRCA